MFRFLSMRRPRAFKASEAATSAVEFALLSPVLIALVFGVLAGSWVLSVQHGLQQLAAESARAALAGMSQSERDSIARSYVATAAPTYAFLDPQAVGVSTVSNDATLSFTVMTTYDLSRSPLFTSLIRFMPVSSSLLSRQATIRQGGFQ